MSGKEENQQLQVAGVHRRSRVKILVAVVAGLCVLSAAAAVLATVMTSSSAPEKSHMTRSLQASPDSSDHMTLPSTAEHNARRAVRTRRQIRASSNPRLTNNPRQPREMSCSTLPSNNTIPAAHIKGHGGKFHESTEDSPPDAPLGYQQRWICDEFETNAHHSAHAFVDGGMLFNQTDKSLYVPTCGYYHVFSQVLFNLAASVDKSVSVYHLMKIQRNCPSWPDQNDVTLLAKNSIGPFEAGSYQGGSVTTHTSDVIRMCKGGRVWIQIKDGRNGVPCCPSGDEHGTFMGAVLVSPTTCHWPPNTEMENLNDPDHQLEME